jgi:hypothetical protein
MVPPSDAPLASSTRYPLGKQRDGILPAERLDVAGSPQASATIIPLRLTERPTQFVVDSKMFFEEAVMCALTLMLAIGIATVLTFALSVLPSVSNLRLGSETERRIVND